MRSFTLALAFAAVTTVSPQPRATGQHQPDAATNIKGTGKMPDGWKVRFDEADAKTDAVVVAEKTGTLTFTTGPAAIYYKPGMKAERDYELTATFSQLKPSEHAEAYGLFIAGQDLDKPTARYTYFLVRQDGKFLIKSRSGEATKTIKDWTDAPAMKEPKGVKTTNTLMIRATEDTVRFFIGDKEVAKLTRAQVGGDGITGLRIKHNLHVQVSKFEVKKLK